MCWHAWNLSACDKYVQLARKVAAESTSEKLTQEEEHKSQSHIPFNKGVGVNATSTAGLLKPTIQTNPNLKSGIDFLYTVLCYFHGYKVVALLKLFRNSDWVWSTSTDNTDLFD